ncbi:MAG: glycosyltransferase [Gammaproteobacteria bacterium]
MMPSVSQSLVIPIYKNAANIPDLLAALCRLHSELNGDLEVVLVVDGSPDNALQLLQNALPEQPYPAQLIELSRNFGSFPDIRHGMAAARGEVIAVMAADLQEPPELILQFFAALRTDQADLVLGYSAAPAAGRGQTVGSVPVCPPCSGHCTALCVKSICHRAGSMFSPVIAARDDLLSLRETNSLLVSQLFWLGHRRLFIPYQRQTRSKGKSAWNLRRKIRYMLDSVCVFRSTDFSAAVAGCIWHFRIGPERYDSLCRVVAGCDYGTRLYPGDAVDCLYRLNSDFRSGHYRLLCLARGRKY